MSSCPVTRHLSPVTAAAMISSSRYVCLSHRLSNSTLTLEKPEGATVYIPIKSDSGKHMELLPCDIYSLGLSRYGVPTSAAFSIPAFKHVCLYGGKLSAVTATDPSMKTRIFISYVPNYRKLIIDFSRQVLKSWGSFREWLKLDLIERIEFIRHTSNVTSGM